MWFYIFVILAILAFLGFFYNALKGRTPMMVYTFVVCCLWVLCAVVARGGIVFTFAQ